jgi:hypothetical protein
MLDPSEPKIFGMDRVDETKKIYITEGPFDSTFLPNAIAMAGADFRGYSGTVIYDNERFNEEIVARMKAVVKRGMGVFVWPKSLGDYNDINDLVLGENYTQEELTSLIDSNTFQGSMAYLKMAKWRN